MEQTNPDFCRSCGTELAAGRGDFYVVRIEAFADPSPPQITDVDLAQDHRPVMQELMKQMEGMSERELLDMVYHKMSFLLCGPCYRQWIENPTA